MPNLATTFPDFDKPLKVTRPNSSTYIGVAYSHNGKGFQFIRVVYDPANGQVSGATDSIPPANYAGYSWEYV